MLEPSSEIYQTIIMQDITVQELKNEPDRYELIDVRNTEERIAFDIGGINLPLNDLDFVQLPATDKPMVIYCASGKRSEAAVRRIQKEFPELRIFSLKGGLKAWREGM